MEKHLPARNRVFRWAMGGLFLVLGSLPWMASLQAAGVVGTGTPGQLHPAGAHDGPNRRGNRNL